MKIKKNSPKQPTSGSWKKGIKSPNPRGRSIQYMPAKKLTRIYTAEVIAKVYGDDAVLDLAQSPAVLPLHPRRLVAILGHGRFIDQPDEAQVVGPARHPRRRAMPRRHPLLQLIAKPQMGVAAQAVYAPAGDPGSPQTLSLAPFTPTASGVLDIRLVSYDQSGVSVVEWDGMVVT